MDALAIAWTVAAFGLGGVLTFITLCVTGQLVPGSRLAKAETAAEHFHDAYDTLKILVKRFDIESDLVGAVLRANHTAITGAAPVTQPSVTP